MKMKVKEASLVHPCAISFIAKKTSASGNGDVRKGIEMLTKVLGDAKAREKLAGKKKVSQAAAGAAAEPQYLVTISDVVKFCNSEYPKLAQMIADLPMYCQIVVCVATRLALENQKAESFVLTRGVLLDRYREVYRKKQLGHFEEADANELIERLGDEGIVEIDRASDIFYHPGDVITFKYSPHDLDVAATESLSSQTNFFASI